MSAKWYKIGSRLVQDVYKLYYGKGEKQMIKITTDKKIRETIAEEMHREEQIRWLNEKYERLEGRLWKLENEVRVLKGETNVDEICTRPKGW